MMNSFGRTSSSSKTLLYHYVRKESTTQRLKDPCPVVTDFEISEIFLSEKYAQMGYPESAEERKNTGNRRLISPSPSPENFRAILQETKKLEIFFQNQKKLEFFFGFHLFGHSIWSGFRKSLPKWRNRKNFRPHFNLEKKIGVEIFFDI